MKKLLIPLLAALALPTGVNANVDPKVAEMCMKAVDFQGCVAAMTGKKPNEYEEGTRESIRDDGAKLIFNPKAVTAIEEKGEYGRYINFRYFLIYADGSGSREWSADADCKDYTANWKGDTGREKGWRNLYKSKEVSSKQAIGVLDEFCPQMDSLVKEAKSGTKEYFKYPAGFSNISRVNRGGGGGSGTANQLRMQQQIHNNKMNIIQNDFNNWHRQEFGY